MKKTRDFPTDSDASPHLRKLTQWLDSFCYPVHVRNELHMAASAAAVWSWLVWAERWWEWYDDAPVVAYINQARDELQVGSVFAWCSQGTTLTAIVDEYVPGQRLAWVVKGVGIRAYHSWVLRETATGCHVITEQTQMGWRSHLHELIQPHHLFYHHQMWLIQLGRQAQQAWPPYIRQGEQPAW